MFSTASSRRTYLSLFVVEPPETPLLSVAGRRVAGGVLKPLLEGDTLVLTCTVEGGVPPPSVTWIRDGKVSVLGEVGGERQQLKEKLVK